LFFTSRQTEEKRKNEDEKIEHDERRRASALRLRQSGRRRCISSSSAAAIRRHQALRAGAGEREGGKKRDRERGGRRSAGDGQCISLTFLFFPLSLSRSLSLFLSKPIQTTPGARASCRDSPWTCGHRRGEWRKLGKKHEDDIRSSNSPTSFFGRPLLSPFFPPLLTSPRLDSSSPARPRSSAPSSSSESAARSPGAAPSPSSPGRARTWPSLRHLPRARSSSTEVRARRRRWARRSRPPSR